MQMRSGKASIEAGGAAIEVVVGPDGALSIGITIIRSNRMGLLTPPKTDRGGPSTIVRSIEGINRGAVIAEVDDILHLVDLAAEVLAWPRPPCAVRKASIMAIAG